MTGHATGPPLHPLTATFPLQMATKSGTLVETQYTERKGLFSIYFLSKSFYFTDRNITLLFLFKNKYFANVVLFFQASFYQCSHCNSSFCASPLLQLLLQ